MALAVALGVAASGGPLGLLWYAIAPKARLVKVRGEVYPADPAPEAFVADDGWYVFLTIGAGLLGGVVAWVLLRRYRGPVVLAGLALGAAAAGVFAAWVGQRIGQPHFLDLVANAPDGTELLRPPTVRTKEVGLWFGVLPRVQGSVLLEAVMAATVYTLLAAFHPAPDLDQQPAPEPTKAGPGIADHGPVQMV